MTVYESHLAHREVSAQVDRVEVMESASEPAQVEIAMAHGALVADMGSSIPLVIAPGRGSRRQWSHPGGHAVSGARQPRAAAG